MKNSMLIFSLFILFSCQMQPASENSRQNQSDSTYYLAFQPVPGSRYYYDISNESRVKVSMNKQVVTNLNNTNVGVTYEIDTVDLSNYVLSIRYGKIEVYTKRGEVISEWDAANASVSSDPVEQMLGVLASSPIKSTVNRHGHVIDITGYGNIVDQIINRLRDVSSYSRNMARDQLTKLIEDVLVKKNMAQLFGALPDSALHIGTEWTVEAREFGEVNLNVHTKYKLEKVRGDYAFLKAKGRLVSDGKATRVMGTNVISELKGTQSGELKLELQTGMLIQGHTEAEIKGVLKLPDREVPIEIFIKAAIEGKRVN